jgi:ferrous iron transport protein B
MKTLETSMDQTPAATHAHASDTPPLRVALLGNPNCGKTALFNLLTGSRQKVANYAGVTVERKVGKLRTASGRKVKVLDLPGAYSLNALSLDEQITRDVMTGQQADEPLPDLLVCVVDATNLRLNLRLVLEARALNLPMVLALNMWDSAQHEGISVDVDKLAQALGVPVVKTVGIRHDGAQELLAYLDSVQPKVTHAVSGLWHGSSVQEVTATQQEVRQILRAAVQEPPNTLKWDDAIDAVALHPLWGMLVLTGTLFLMFQAVFSWATVPMNAIKASVQWLGEGAQTLLGDGPLTRLLVDGVLAGAGGVLVFLPQILILFLFILALEDSGYLPRAAFLLDRVMGTVGLSGRSFIPLLSSFACAIPGIMATRTITHWRDRLVTIMIAPLMTCSARLPVYALLIGAFIPSRPVLGVFNLQGLVMFGLYFGGIVSAMLVAWVFQFWRSQGRATPLLMELPSYRWPNLRGLAQGLWERTLIFVQRVGGIILAIMVLLWFLSNYPTPPEGFAGPAIQYSLAGRLGHALEWLVAPIGFNWQIAVALVPGLAAREVAVGALGTVYAVAASGDDVASQLSGLIGQSWSLATALSLLAWYVFAPQCISTLVAVRRETNGWRYVVIMAAYLFGLAYAASWVTYRLTLWLGGS